MGILFSFINQNEDKYAIYTFVPFLEFNPMQISRIEIRCEDISTANKIIHILFYGLILLRIDTLAHKHNSVEIPPKIQIALFVCSSYDVYFDYFLFYFNCVCWVIFLSICRFRMSVNTWSSLYANLFAQCDEISGNVIARLCRCRWLAIH